MLRVGLTVLVDPGVIATCVAYVTDPVRVKVMVYTPAGTFSKR